MHVQVKIVVINLPKARCALISNRAEVVLPIWVIVRCEGVIPAHLIQKVGHIFQPLYALSDYDTTLHEGLPCVIIKCCYNGSIDVRHSLQLWQHPV